LSKFLFLDFDGVLHSTKDYAALFENVNSLTQLVVNYPIQIVISSSWRFQFDLTQLKSYFPQQIQHKIVGATGKEVVDKYPRYHEIKNYLKERDKSLCDWRALDDTSFEFPTNCEQLILCNPNFGLQQKQLDILEQWLKN